MKTSLQITTVLALLALVSLGCACRKQCAENCCPPSFNCYGYYGTCWRPWPEECPPCPSYAILPPMHEHVLSDVPLKQESLPPGRNGPAPPTAVPEEALPPVVEPKEGRAKPRGGDAKVAMKKTKQARPESR